MGFSSPTSAGMFLPTVHTDLPAFKSPITQDPESSTFDVILQGGRGNTSPGTPEAKKQPRAQPEGGSGADQLKRMLTSMGQTRGGALWSEGSENRECLEEIVHALNLGQTK